MKTLSAQLKQNLTISKKHTDHSAYTEAIGIAQQLTHQKTMANNIKHMNTTRCEKIIKLRKHEYKITVEFSYDLGRYVWNAYKRGPYGYWKRMPLITDADERVMPKTVIKQAFQFYGSQEWKDQVWENAMYAGITEALAQKKQPN